MKVNVDPDRCQGHARCWEICPEVFSLDEVGNAVAAAAEVSPGLEAEVAKAVSNCPERAISVSLPGLAWSGDGGGVELQSRRAVPVVAVASGSG